MREKKKETLQEAGRSGGKGNHSGLKPGVCMKKKEKAGAFVHDKGKEKMKIRGTTLGKKEGPRPGGRGDGGGPGSDAWGR